MDSLDRKITELCQEYHIPESLMREAIAKEKQKIVYKNRQMSPEIIKLIEQYLDSAFIAREDG
jgi:hypothetical protein